MLDLFLIAQLQTAPKPIPCSEAKPVQVEAPETQVNLAIEAPELTSPEPPVRILPAPIPSSEHPLPDFEYLRCRVCQLVPHWQLKRLR